LFCNQVVTQADLMCKTGAAAETHRWLRPAAWVAADIVRWDVLQDEATKAQSVSGLPMFGDRFPD
jgi:hypothetical protein